MDEDTRAAVKDALVREVIGIAALMAILWALGPGRTLVPAWVARCKAMMGGSDPFEGQVRQFAREVSEYDHEQTAKSDRRPAAGGPCGCGGLRPPGRHRPDAA